MQNAIRRTKENALNNAPARPATPTLLQAALAYRQRGWSIIPIKPGTKVPSINWKAYQHRLPTEDEIRVWYPSVNGQGSPGVAVVLGAVSGRLAVRDFDVDSAYQEWVDDYPEYARALPTVRTPRGAHLYFRLPADSQITSTLRLSDGELRTEGGIVLLPPSIHPTGVHYDWIVSLPEGELPEIDPFELGLATPPTRQPSGPSDAIVEGNRNHTLTSVAGTLRRQGLSEAAIGAALRVENERRCHPPLETEEVLGIAKSIAKYPPASATIRLSENRTDLGNARRLVHRHGQNLRYVPQWKRWLVWNEVRWQEDGTGEVMRLAKETVRDLYHSAAEADDGERSGIGKWAIQSESEHRLQAMINLASSEPGVPVSIAELDRDIWLLNVQNGTINLQTGLLLPHRRTDLITRLVPAEYDLAAECPLWERFLARVLNNSPELIAFIQRAIGYALTGCTREHCLFICHGSGRNGKSTMLETLAALLNDYAQQMPTETILASRNATMTNDLARLRGARLVTAVEVDEGRHLRESLVKQMTGGDRISARYLYSEFFEFVPQCKLFLAVNHLPEIRGTDTAIWERIRRIPFTVTIPEPERDRALPEKLREELSGILHWAVTGGLLWQREGLGGSREVHQATEAYRTEMDMLGAFIEAKCMLAPLARCASGQLYQAYTQWCVESNEKPLALKKFVPRMEERGYTRTKNSRSMWSGIGILEERNGEGNTTPQVD